MLLRASSLVAIAAGLLLSGVQADERAHCYFPGGDFAPGFYPCIPFDAAYSNCCPAGWSCFSNALCVPTTSTEIYPNLTYGAVQRAACTAPKWANNVCGDFCLDADNKEGKMIYCGNDRFCCEGDFNSGKCSCPDRNTTLIRPGRFQGVVLVPTATFIGTSPSMSIATTSANIRPTSATTITGSGSQSSGAGGPSATAESATDTSSGGGKNLALIIGLSVGLGLGLLMLAALAFVLYRRWKRRQPRPPTPVPIELKPSSTPSVATPAPAAPVDAYIDDDLREDDPNGPRYRNDWGTPRRVDI